MFTIKPHRIWGTIAEMIFGILVMILRSSKMVFGTVDMCVSARNKHILCARARASTKWRFYGAGDLSGLFLENMDPKSLKKTISALTKIINNILMVPSSFEKCPPKSERIINKTENLKIWPQNDAQMVPKGTTMGANMIKKRARFFISPFHQLFIVCSLRAVSTWMHACLRCICS